MQRSRSWPSPGSWQQLGVCALAVFLTLFAQCARADESGVSFWIPGQFGSLAAVPTTPGRSLGTVYYHTSVAASGGVAAAREIQIGRFAPTVNVSLNANLNSPADLVFLSPTYTFATPVLGGQFSAGVTGIFGRVETSIAGTLTTAVGPTAVQRTGTISDSLTSVGDLYPMLTLKWNNGVNNWMTYLTGDIPVGAYDPNRLSNLGIGHGAIDGGGGYTYLNSVTGHEFSAVAGLQLQEPGHAISKRNRFPSRLGIASQFLSKQFFVGLVGYAYQQVTADSGQHPILGPFKSRVLGIGLKRATFFRLERCRDI